eukprot:scaffold17354_cov64-Phaeocystis_antarctica.AAC.1
MRLQSKTHGSSKDLRAMAHTNAELKRSKLRTKVTRQSLKEEARSKPPPRASSTQWTMIIPSWLRGRDQAPSVAIRARLVRYVTECVHEH